jgi:hypothetical protein
MNTIGMRNVVSMKRLLLTLVMYSLFIMSPTLFINVI